MTTVCTAWRQAVVGDPRAWAASYKRELFESLVRCGVDEVGLRSGLARLKAARRDFLPNPDAFAELCCSPEDLGLPREDAAYRMAVNWSELPANERHPAVLVALRGIDSWQLRSQPEDKTRKLFVAAWRKVVARVRAEGREWLPELPPELEYQPPGTKAPRELGRAAISGILRDLGVGS